MKTLLYATRHKNKTSISPSLLSLKTPPFDETKNNTTSTNTNHTIIPRASMASLFLSYLSPFPSSSSNSNKKNRNKDRKNPRLVDSNDPVLMLSPRVGCMGQIKTRKPSSHDVRKGKQKESNILVRCLAPLFKGSSKVQDVPMSVKMLVSITEMDPPLPVRMKKHEDLYKLSLWERRPGGCKELQKLQLTEKRRQLTTIAEICLFS